jgi:rubrerythrin
VFESFQAIEEKRHSAEYNKARDEMKERDFSLQRLDYICFSCLYGR